MHGFGKIIGVVALLSLPLVLSLARGQDPGTDPEEPLGKALETILTRLMTADAGVRLGISEEEAIRLTPGATNLSGDRVLALSETPYAPDGAWKGTLRIFVVGESDAKLDNIQICLLAERYDEAKLARRVVEIGRKLGFSFEADEESPNTWYDRADHRHDLWISFGRGVVVIDADFWEAVPDPSADD